MVEVLSNMCSWTHEFTCIEEVTRLLWFSFIRIKTKHLATPSPGLKPMIAMRNHPSPSDYAGRAQLDSGASPHVYATHGWLRPHGAMVERLATVGTALMP